MSSLLKGLAEGSRKHSTLKAEIMKTSDDLDAVGSQSGLQSEDQNRFTDNDDYEDYDLEYEVPDDQPTQHASRLKRRLPSISSSSEEDIEDDDLVAKKKTMPSKTRTTKSLSVDIATELHARMRIYCFKNDTNLVKVIEKWIVQNCPE